jgi:hypothetical protein
MVGVLAPFLSAAGMLAMSPSGLCAVKYVPQLSFLRHPGLVNEGSGRGTSSALSISSLVYSNGLSTPFAFWSSTVTIYFTPSQ